MEIVRFGVGHRRPDGPPGTTGVSGQVIHSDARGVVSELAFARRAAIEPHSNPNTTWFVVIEGGGYVQVGEEQARVAAGEAVLWPAGIDHAAWTEHGEMRAFVIEFAGADDSAVGGPAILPGKAVRLLPGETGEVERGTGELRDEWARAPGYDPSEGEPS
jgi:quercetin dioxygenase-like cupin family protein